MTDQLILTLSTNQWELVADTGNPADPTTPGARLLDGATTSWSCDVLPPQATTPQLASLSVYDDGQGPDGWLWLEHGQPARVTLDARLDSGVLVRVADINGRIVEPAASNHPTGGVIYQLVVADHLADLAAAGAPGTVTGHMTDGITTAYTQLADDEDLTFSWTDGASSPVEPFRMTDYDSVNQPFLDVITTYITHDVRDHPSMSTEKISRYLAQDLLMSTSVPVDPPSWFLPEYQQHDASAVAAALELVWTGVGWTAQADPTRPDDSFTMILPAAQLLSDVGEWRKTRHGAINRVELTGLFDNGSGGTQKSTRRSFADLVAEYGPNTRTGPSPLYWRSDAWALGEYLLGRRVDIDNDWSFDTATLVWEALTDGQRVALTGGAGAVTPTLTPGGRAMGHPVAITGVDPSWRLHRSHFAVTGRLMGVHCQLAKGKLRVAFTIRAMPLATPDTWPPQTQWGITFAELATMTPSPPRFDNVDPDITIFDAALIGSP